MSSFKAYDEKYPFTILLSMGQNLKFADMENIQTGDSKWLRAAFVCTLVILSARTTTAQRSAADELFTNVVAGCELKISCIETKTAEMYPLTPNEGCEEKMLRAALLLFDRNPSDPIRFSSLTDLSGCDTSISVLRYNLGVLFWKEERLNAALHQFLKGSDLVNGPDRAAFLTAAGTICYQELRYKDALQFFSQAFSADSSNTSPMLLNNLCAISNKLSRSNEAIRWGELALDRFRSIDNHTIYGLPDEFAQLVYYNLLVSSIGALDTNRVSKYWNEVELDELALSGPDLAEIITRFVRITGNTGILDIYQEKLNTALAEFEQQDSTIATSYRSDPLIFLYTQKGMSLLKGQNASTAWDALVPHFPIKSIQQGPLPPNSHSISNLPKWLVGALWICFVLLFIRYRRLKFATTNALDNRLKRLHTFLENGQSNDEVEGIIAFLIQWASRFENDSLLLSHPPVLSDSEKRVFLDDLAGLSPKDTARSEDWTPQYVYNQRSELRRKLDIPPEMDFTSWAKEHSELTERLFGKTITNK